MVSDDLIMFRTMSESAGSLILSISSFQSIHFVVPNFRPLVKTSVANFHGRCLALFIGWVVNPSHRNVYVPHTITFSTTDIDLAGTLVLCHFDKCWVVLYTFTIYQAVYLELIKLSHSINTNELAHSLFYTKFVLKSFGYSYIYN